MRCGCPHCESFMVQEELSRSACVCPECGYRCDCLPRHWHGAEPGGYPAAENDRVVYAQF